MSNTRIYLEAWSGNDRRRHTRTQPTDLVYVDLGPENGGIITDVTEDGAGVQAVSPLDALPFISICFQVPNSQSQINGVAQIAWVSESRRHAGLSFSNVADDSRAKIREWLGSAGPTADNFPHEAVLRTKPSADGSTSNSPTNQPPDLVTKQPAEHAGAAAPPTTARPTDARREVTFIRETMGAPPVPSAIPLHGFLREIALAKESRSQRELSGSDGADAPPITSPNQRPKSDASVIEQDAKNRQEPVFSLPAGRAQTDRKMESAPGPPLHQTNQSNPSTGANPNGRVVARTASPARTAPARNRPLRILQVIALAMGAAAVCIVSFGIGRWLGAGRDIQPAPEAPAPAKHETSVTTVATAPPRQIIASGGQSATTREHEAQTIEHKVAVRNPRITQPGAPSIAVSAGPSAPVVVTPPVHPTMTIIQTQQTIQNSQTKPTAQAASPIVVDGRTLAPTDRFNPAHLIYRFDPEYPSTARAQQIEGIVTLHLTIDASGAVQNVRALSGPATLIPFAVAAAKNWRYLPALLNGDPVNTDQDVQIRFQLRH